MRKKIPQEGDIRRRTAFLWLPLTIGDEVRWLETATWTERLEVFVDNTVILESPWEADTLVARWKPLRWAGGRQNA